MKKIHVYLVVFFFLFNVATTLAKAPPCSAGTITGVDSVCTGTTVTLTDSMTGGTWSTTNAALATISSGGVVYGITTGYDTVVYSESGCQSIFPIKINFSPIFRGFSISSDTICYGGAVISFIRDTGGVVIYYTQGTDTFSIGFDDPGFSIVYQDSTHLYTGALYSTTTYKFISLYSDITGCTTNLSDSITITVNPPTHSITGDTIVCLGTPDSLHCTPAYGTWATGSTSVATVGYRTGVVTGISTGATTVSYTAGTGCISTADLTVNAPPAAITGADSVCTGSTVALTDTTSGGTWSTTNAALATISSGGVVYGITTGYDTVVYSESGCQSIFPIKINFSPIFRGFSISSDTICYGGAVISYIRDTAAAVVFYMRGTDTFGLGYDPLTPIVYQDSVTFYTGALYSTTTYKFISLYSDITGCTTNLSDSITITVNPPTHSITGDTIVCLGTPDSLHCTPAYGTWATGSTSVATVGYRTGAVTGISTGATTVSYTAPGTGCISTADVTVNAPPAAITGADSVCTGSTVALTDTTSGGTWSTTNAALATISSGGVVTAISAGADTIMYTAEGCAALVPVTVNPLPSAVTGIFNICHDASAALSDTSATAGVSGTWSISSTAIATITSPASGTGSPEAVVTGVDAGTATITYTLPTGCFTAATLTINPTPGAIYGPSGVCVGDSITLYDSTTGGSWSVSPGAYASINAATGVLTGLSSGVVSVVYTLPATGCTASYEVLVNPIPVITGADSVCSGATSSLSAMPSGGVWASSDMAVASVATVTGLVSGITAGTSFITYTSPAGCTTDTSFLVNQTPGNISGPAAVCAGSSITLTDTTADGTWSLAPSTLASINSVTGVLTGISSGTVNAVYTLPPGGCTSSYNIEVDPLPVISGADSVCTGLTSALSATPPGGIWSSLDTAIASIDTTSGLVSGITAGTATIKYTSPAGCITTYALTVNPLPLPVSGAAVLCAGLTTAYTDPSADGTWSAGPASVATINATTGELEGISPGAADITYTLPTGCIATFPLTIDLAPSPIYGADTLCFNSTTVLTEGITGGVWTSSDPSIASVDTTGSVSGLSVGAATITYTLPTGCIQVLGMTVNPLPAPISGSGSVCVAAYAHLSDSSTGGTWTTYPASTATIDPETGIAEGISSGTVTVVYTLPTGCITDTSEIVNPIPLPITGASSVCEADSTTMLTDATPSGTWSIATASVASINSSGLVTGLSAGATTVSYTLPVTGCYVVKTFTVNPLPAAISGTNSVCISSSTTFSDTPTGGLWSDAVAGVVSVNSVTGTVTGLSAGVTTLTYTLGGCQVRYDLNVYPDPSAYIIPIGDTVICPGGLVDLTANTGDSLTYNWYRNDILTAIDSSTYIATDSGSYKVKVTNEYGCSTFSAPVSVSTIEIIADIFSVDGSDSTCYGTPLELSTDLGAGLSYQWKLNGRAIAGATSATYYVTDSSGRYSVVISNGGCTQSSDALTIGIKEIPIPSILTGGTTTFCYGSDVLLSSEAGFSYQWYRDSTIIPGATSESYTATSSGNYYLDATNNTTGCSGYSSPIAVTEVPLPDDVITMSGPDDFCSGGNVMLNLPAVSGITYQWYNDRHIITGATDYSYNDTVSGIFNAVLTDTSGCSDTSANITVTNLGNLSIRPLTATSFCWGSSATLSLNLLAGATGLSYQWMYNGHNIAGATTATYDAFNAGYYSCEVNAATCAQGVDSILITEYPLPDPIITFDGLSTLSAQSYFTGYQWYRNTAAIPGATNNTIAAAVNGSYVVDVIDTNGCNQVSDVFVLSDLSAGNFSSSGIKIYPNPAERYLFIISPVDVKIEITNISGKLMIAANNSKQIDISALSDGVYFIKIFDEKNLLLKIEKLIKVSD